MIGNEITHPTVLAIHLNTEKALDGCGHYRFRIPFEELRRRVPGGTFDWAPITKVREWAARGRQAETYVAPDGRVLVQRKPMPSDYDLFLMPRFRPLPYGEGEFEAIPEETKTQLAEMGIELTGKSHLIDLMQVLRGHLKVVVEYDDDYFTRSRELAYDRYDLLYEFLQGVDAFTVSTPYLRDLIHRYAPGIPVYVLPNCIVWQEWQHWEMALELPKDKIILGLTGSQTHYDDWRVLETVLPRILETYPQAYFMAGAFLPDYLEPLLDRFPDQAKHVRAVAYEEYPGIVRQADIVLCPVDPEDEFNFGKSAIKAIEGLAAGRTLANGTQGGGVPITSDLYYYRRVTGGNKRGLTVAHTPEAWYDAISTLIENDDLRMRLAKKGHGWVRANRAIESKWSLWWDAYRKIHNRRTA